MLVIVEISVVPLGVGTSVSKYVKSAIEALERSGVRYYVGPMSTSFETDSVEKALEVVKLMHEAVLEAGAQRVVTTVKIDDRRDKPASMESKLASLGFEPSASQ